MLAWLRGYHDAVRSAIRPGAYANYADPDPVDWPEVYYGANYARPQRVKARYDPDNVFTFSAVRPRLGTHRPTGFL